VDTSKHAGLQPLHGYDFLVFASAGLEAKAAQTAERCRRARAFFARLFGIEPEFALLVLTPGDWQGRSYSPLYGVPNADMGNIVVAGERSDLSREIVGGIGMLLPGSMPELHEVYATPDGDIDVTLFFDLFVVHELAHIFHMAVPFRFPRLWLEELFVNLAMHAYLVEHEPEQVPCLHTFARVLAALPPEILTYRRLVDFEERYGNMPPENFAWFQGRFVVEAGRIYDAGGAGVLTRMWDACVLSDRQLEALLRQQVQPDVAQTLTEWERGNPTD
jgi:hypothetical protein